MNDDNLQDLKQFIASTVSQQISLHTTDLKNDINKLDIKLSKKIDDLSLAVGEAIETTNSEADKQIKNLEVRVTKLEQKVV